MTMAARRSIVTKEVHLDELYNVLRGDRSYLTSAFLWSSSVEEHSYNSGVFCWSDVFEDTKPLSDDIIRRLWRIWAVEKHRLGRL